jgi:hypothetical protein
MKKVKRLLLPFILFSCLFIVGIDGQEAQAITSASFDSLTVTITGPGLQFLSPTNFLAQSHYVWTYENAGEAVFNPLINAPVPFSDTRVLSAQGINFAAEAKGVDLSASGSGFTMLFHSHTAWAKQNIYYTYCHAAGLAGIDFTVVGDPGIADFITIAYLFSKASINDNSGEAFINVDTYGYTLGLDEHRRFYEGDTIQIDPVTVNLSQFGGGETGRLSVYPWIHASAQAPFPPAALLLGSVLLPLFYVRSKKRG